ncbi:MAG TPA: hypothetical protein VN618_09390 [Solirubrobacteraceae bacterium]|nr:hypothetical protein [Solirubrobacteraceae bacterium]
MSDQRLIPISIQLDGRELASETISMWTGPYVLTISTTLPDHGLALEVHSVFVGHKGLPTHVTHLTLGPVGQKSTIVHRDHDDLDPALSPRDCAYEHANAVLDALTQQEANVSIEVNEAAFIALERVEPR